MENKSSKLGIIGLTVFLTLALVAAGIGIYFKTSGKVIVDEKDFEEVVEQQEDMQKFYRIQNRIDENFLFDYDKEEEMENIYRAMLDSLGDPYSRYLDEEDVKDLEATLNNSFSGVGIVIERREDGAFVVLSVIPEGPAEKADVQPGDIILKVDGTEYEYLDEVANAIRGETGTTVAIEFQRDKETMEKKLVRGQITEASITTNTLEGNIGYIHINSFGRETFDKFNAALTGFEDSGAKGVIIDLRNNPGGLMDGGIKIADRILPECLITYTEDNKGNREEYYSDGATTALKIVVIINGNTASASELLASAIKDNGAGTIIGTTSFGKGIVQETTMFGDGTAMSITTNQYFSPKGNVIHGKGVEPDIVVEPTSTTEDVQLKAAIEALN